MFIELFDYIGYYGPVILFTITFYCLIERTPYLIVFVVGSILNSLLNSFLKSVLREPRPNGQIDFIDHNHLIGSNLYGLPSGHAQSVFFSLTFLYLSNGPIPFLYLMACITILTIYQRWKYKRHSIKQLSFGAIIGILYGWVLVYLTKYELHSYKNKFLVI